MYLVDLESRGRGQAGGIPLCPRLVQVWVDGQHGENRDLPGTCKDKGCTAGVSAEDSVTSFCSTFVLRINGRGKIM